MLLFDSPEGKVEVKILRVNIGDLFGYCKGFQVGFIPSLAVFEADRSVGGTSALLPERKSMESQYVLGLDR